MTRDSDADFGASLRRGKGLAAIVVAIVLGTSGVLAAAYSLARTEAQAAAAAEVRSDATRERVELVAKHVVQSETGQTLGRLDERTSQLQKQLDRIENAIKQQPERRR